MRRDLDETVIRLGLLDDPARWAAYRAVRSASGPLTRAEVADEVGISARLAAFHLEKLVAEGFLETTYARLEPAVVGHPAKRYRPTGLEVELSIPPRRYDLAAEILAEAMDHGAPDQFQATLDDVAAEHGRRVGASAQEDNGDSRTMTALRVVGYEPTTAGDDVLLRNCPFRRVAQVNPEVICRMNVAFVAGLLEGAQAPTLRAVLSPSSDRCCVVVAP